MTIATIAALDTLVTVVYRAHSESACRGNISHKALQLAAVGSGDYLKSICAALMTLGGVHAPLLATYDLLSSLHIVEDVEMMMSEGKRVPGWGNAFVKGSQDPIWQPVHNLLCDINPELVNQIDAVTSYLHRLGKKIFPNPSCYTAATAILIEMPRDITPSLLLNGRLPAWTDEFVRIRNLK